jgi:phosphatidylglycerol:prolipoprotein diacylglycerol transferase
MNTSINFPNLGIHLSNVGKSISIGGFEIAYYGMIIACGMILGLCIAMWVAKKTNQNPDQYFDVALYAIPIALIGARAYYVIFSWDQYKDNLIHILYFREGGLAIFGGVIAAGKDRVNGLQQGKANGFGQVTATGTPPVIRGARIV